MARFYDFQERLEFSKGRRGESDIATLETFFPTAVSVKATDVAMDRAGVDYIVTLRRGATITVDAKARTKGCSKWWSGEPDVALEVWSVKPDNGPGTGKVGWTLDEAKEVDLIMFTFDAADHDLAYLFDLPLLREAFRRNLSAWRHSFQAASQSSGSWRSECVFVPISAAQEAVAEVSEVWRTAPELGQPRLEFG